MSTNNGGQLNQSALLSKDNALLAGPFEKTIEDPLRYLRISTICSFEPGAVIYSVGSPATNMFLVISGRVRVGRVLKSGREVIVAIYESDEVFGESALIEPRRSSFAIALESTKVMAWTAAQIEAVGQENPRLFYALLQAMTERLRRHERRIGSAMVESAQCRLARALLELSRGSQSEPAKILPLTHELLASYIGTTREAVTLFMNQFRRLGYVTYSRKGMLIFREQLSKLVDEELGEGCPGLPVTAEHVGQLGQQA